MNPNDSKNKKLEELANDVEQLRGMVGQTQEAIGIIDEIIKKVKGLFGDDEAPIVRKLGPCTTEVGNNCCKDEDFWEGVPVSVMVEVEEKDDWGKTKGISEVLVQPLTADGKPRGSGGTTPGGGFIGKKQFQVKLCIPCSVVQTDQYGQPFVSLQATACDGADNVSDPKVQDFPLDKGKAQECCRIA